MPVGKIDRLFQRIDTNGDGQIDRKEVTAFAKAADVDSGFLGGMKLSATVDGFMSAFDRNQDGKVSRRDLEAKGASLLPPQIADQLAKNPAGVGKVIDMYFAKTATRADGKLRLDDLQSSAERELDARGAAFSGQKAEIGAKLALHAFDEDQDGALTKQDILDVVDDVAHVAKSHKTSGA